VSRPNIMRPEARAIRERYDAEREARAAERCRREEEEAERKRTADHRAWIEKRQRLALAREQERERRAAEYRHIREERDALRIRQHALEAGMSEDDYRRDLSEARRDLLTLLEAMAEGLAALPAAQPRPERPVAGVSGRRSGPLGTVMLLASLLALGGER
jgi:hypothetical protein